MISRGIFHIFLVVFSYSLVLAFVTVRHSFLRKIEHVRRPKNAHEQHVKTFAMFE